MKGYLLYDTEDNYARTYAEGLKKSLIGFEVQTCDLLNGFDKKEMLECEFLIVVLVKENDANLLSISQNYRCYLDELAWKRKTVGEVVVVLDSSVRAAFVPYRLKKCKCFDLNNSLDVEEYIKSVKGKINTDAVPSVTQMKFSARAKSVNQFDYTPKLPTVKRFENISVVKGRPERSGCKDDHIFDQVTNTAGIYEKTSYDKTKKVDKSGYKSANSQVHSYEKASKSEVKKTAKNRSGCLIFFCMLPVLIAIVVAIVIIASNFSKFSSSYINFENIYEPVNQVMTRAFHLIK